MKLRRYFTRRRTPNRSFGTPPTRAPEVPTAPPLRFPFHKVHRRDPHTPPPRRRPQRLGVSAALAVNAVAMSVLAWGLASWWHRADSDGIYLPAGDSSSKVNATVQAPDTAPSQYPEPPRLELSKASAPPLEVTPPRAEPPIAAVVETPMAAPPGIEVVPPPLPVVVPEVPSVELPLPPPPPAVEKKAPPPQEPVVPAPSVDIVAKPYLAPTHGETPMLRNWKMLAAITTVLTVTPVSFAQDNDKTIKDDIKAILDRLDKMDGGLKESFKNVGDSIKKVEKDLASLTGLVIYQDAELKRQDAEIKRLRADFDALRGTKVGSSPVALEELKAEIAKLQQAVARLEGRERTVLSPGTGRVVLVNLYPEELLFILNGKTYRVPPSTTMPVEGVPAGELTYEVISQTWGRRALRTTTLAAGETFTLTAR